MSSFGCQLGGRSAFVLGTGGALEPRGRDPHVACKAYWRREEVPRTTGASCGELFAGSTAERMATGSRVAVLPRCKMFRF